MSETFEAVRQQRDAAVQWIRIVAEELVNAGFPAGDRTVQLKNIRDLIREVKQKRAQTPPPLTPDARRKACLIPFTDEEWSTWENGEEEYVVPLIKKYLRTPIQKKEMDDFDITIEDMLNGRVEGVDARGFVALTFMCWNARLGYKHFGG